jgi:hypothetical protein
MDLQMEYICQYFPESWNKFIAYATITDEKHPLVIYRWEYK